MDLVTAQSFHEFSCTNFFFHIGTASVEYRGIKKSIKKNMCTMRGICRALCIAKVLKLPVHVACIF